MVDRLQQLGETGGARTEIGELAATTRSTRPGWRLATDDERSRARRRALLLVARGVEHEAHDAVRGTVVGRVAMDRDEEIGVKGVGARGPLVERDGTIVVAREQRENAELARQEGRARCAMSSATSFSRRPVGPMAPESVPP